MIQPVLSCVPSFTLRAIDPLQILQQYLDGEFAEVTNIPSKVTTVKGTSILTQGYGADVNSEVYVVRDKNNNQQTIITTNHEAYSAMKDGNLYQPKRCCWCRKKFTPNEAPVGIPTYFLKDEKGKTIFYCDRLECNTYECALAVLRNGQQVRQRKDPLYMDSEQLLKLQCKMDTGHDNLQEALDWRLYHKNGGHLSDEEYFRGTHKYRRTSNIVSLPIKVAYIQQPR